MATGGSTEQTPNPQRSSSKDGLLNNHIALQEWVIQHGGHLDDSVQLARDESRGVHIQVKPDCASGVQPGTCVIRTPLSLTMSYFDAVDFRPSTPTSTSTGNDSDLPFFSSHGVTFPREFIDAVGPEETTAFFLVGQYLRGPEGFWYPYIRTLPPPEELTMPLYYEGEDLEWLKGTSLYVAREQRMEVWKGKYENGVKVLRDLGFEGVEGYTWDLYKWASTIIASRAFSSKILSGVIGASDLPEDRMSVLLPLIDVTNHRPLAKVEWKAGEKDIGVNVLENVAASQEVGNNYGPRNNEQLMMNYGFCIPGNPVDYRVVSLRAPPGSPLYEAKGRQQQLFPNAPVKTEDRYYVFNVSYPLLDPNAAMEHSIFSPDLFDAVSVLSANDREFETLEVSEDAVRIPVQPYGNSRNILASLSQIVIELITHIVKLKSSAQTSQQPQNLKQIHAEMYRDSQVTLSETAMIIAEWTLARAREQGITTSSGSGKEKLLESHLSRLPAGKFSEETIAQIRSTILGRKSLLKHEGELFQFRDLFGALPAEMQEPCRNCLRNVLSHAEQFIAPQKPDNASGPLGFSVFLCFLIATYRFTTSSPENGKVQLSPRLTRWARFLLEAYPAPPADVAWVLPDEDDEALLSNFDDLVETMRSQNPQFFSSVAHLTGDWQSDGWWLSPNWLRWAWMAAEQEMVNVPDDPLRFITTGSLGAGGPVMLSTISYLYIPQDADASGGGS